MRGITVAYFGDWYSVYSNCCPFVHKHNVWYYPLGIILFAGDKHEILFQVIRHSIWWVARIVEWIIDRDIKLIDAGMCVEWEGPPLVLIPQINFHL